MAITCLSELLGAELGCSACSQTTLLLRDGVRVLFPFLSTSAGEERGEEVLVLKPYLWTALLAVADFPLMSQEVRVGESLTVSQELQALD